MLVDILLGVQKLNLITFPLRVKPELKEAIRDHAKVENRTQTDLIREAVQLYLLANNRQLKIEHKQKYPA